MKLKTKFLLCSHGKVQHVVIDRNRGQALVFYKKFEEAQAAVTNLRGRKMKLLPSRLRVDFASHELVEMFLSHMRQSGTSFFLNLLDPFDALLLALNAIRNVKLCGISTTL